MKKMKFFMIGMMLLSSRVKAKTKMENKMLRIWIIMDLIG